MTKEDYIKQFNEDEAVGWDSIDAVLKKLYLTQEPKHFASVPHFKVGGENPLDGISIYISKNQEDHFHFVTYGFSELYYNEERAGGDFSGYGFELTFRLKKQEDQNVNWAVNFLQNIAKYVFRTGNYFEEYHVFPSNGPIRLDYNTKIVAVAFIEDKELGSIETPNGQVQFLQIVGLTEDEFEAFKINPTLSETEKILDRLKIDNPLLITNLDRQ